MLCACGKSCGRCGLRCCAAEAQARPPERPERPACSVQVRVRVRVRVRVKGER